MAGTPPEYSFDDAPPLTGERTVPGIPEENYWFCRHVAAYRFAAERVTGLRVLDAGCGEGYGAGILADVAAEVVGVDLDPAILSRAASRYPGAAFEPADLLSLHYPDASFGAVVSLQVIEHLRAPGEFLSEVARVLAPNGVLILATPNRLTFSPEGIRNLFHTVEFSAAELRGVLERRFVVDEMLGTFHTGRVRLIERTRRISFPERLLEQSAPEWPGWLRAAVERVTPDDFRLRAQDVDRSLDLVAVARRK